MSGPRRRKFVGSIVSRATWHGGRGTPYLRRWALIIALAHQRADFLRGAALGGCGTASVGNEAPDCCRSLATIAVQPVW